MKLQLLLILLSVFLVGCYANPPEPTRTLHTLNVDVFPMDVVRIPVTADSTCFYFDEYIVCRVVGNLSITNIE